MLLNHSQTGNFTRHIVTRSAFKLAIFMLAITSSMFYVTNVSAADGDVDPTFTASVGADSVVFAVAAQPDSKVVIGGQFTTVNNESRLGIARLQGTPGTTADDIFIEGFIRRSSGAPIGGVRVTLSGSVQDETTTDAAGHYRFSVPAGGVYQVSAAARGVRFSPSRLTFGSTVVNQVGDFTASSVKGRSNLRAR